MPTLCSWKEYLLKIGPYIWRKCNSHFTYSTDSQSCVHKQKENVKDWRISKFNYCWPLHSNPWRLLVNLFCYLLMNVCVTTDALVSSDIFLQHINRKCKTKIINETSCRYYNARLGCKEIGHRLGIQAKAGGTTILT